MDREKACEILRVSLNAKKEEINEAFHELAKKYHPDMNSNKELEQKFKEITEARAYLIKNLDNIDIIYGTSREEKKPEKRRRRSRRRLENEKAFDELQEAIKNYKKELHELNIHIFPPIKKECSEPNQRGTTEASILNDEKERLRNAVNEIIRNAEAYDKFLETIQEIQNQYAELNLKIKSVGESLNPKFRGKYAAADLEKIQAEKLEEFARIKRNVEEFDSFLEYIDARKSAIKIIEPELNITAFIEQLKRKRGNLDVSEIQKIKEQLEMIIAEKEQNVTDFRAFFKDVSERVEKLYNVSLSKWDDYNTNSYEYSYETLIEVEKEIKKYENELMDKAKAFDDFSVYYENLKEDEKDIYAQIADIDEYLDKKNRIKFNEKEFDALKEKFEKIKKEREYREAYEDFVSYFHDKEKELQKRYGKNLNKWHKYLSNKENYNLDDIEQAKKEIIDYEKSLEEQRQAYIEECMKPKKDDIFNETVALEIRKSALKKIKEQERLQAFEEFLSFFQIKEKELIEKYNRDLHTWNKYIIDNKKHSIEELEQAKEEILSFEEELRENLAAYEDFMAYYKLLSLEEKEIIESIADFDKYINKNNRALYSKEVYDGLKKQALSIKKEREERKRKEHYLEVKNDFIRFFNESKKRFHDLYGIELSKWEKYSDKDKNFNEEEYIDIKNEIKELEEKEEHKRMDKLYNLQKVLKIFKSDPAEFLSYNGKDISASIQKVSIQEVDRYLEYFFGISSLIYSIKKLDSGEEKLNAFLEVEENRKNLLKYNYKDLVDLYSSICVDIAREDAKSKEEFKKFYQKKEHHFKELYDANLSDWSKYISESTEKEYSKKDYENAINEIMEEEARLENERMSLGAELRKKLEKVGIDFNDYLIAKGKKLSSVSNLDFEEYLKTIEILLKISSSNRGIELLTQYLVENKMKIVEIDYKAVLTIYTMLDMENELDEQELDDNYKKHF